MKHALILSALFVAGCYTAPDTLKHPDSDEAVEIIADWYGMTARPEVIWVEPKDGYPRGAIYKCEHAFVEWDGEVEIWHTALAHELAHCAQLELEGDSDSHHTDWRWWQEMEPNAALVLMKELE